MENVEHGGKKPRDCYLFLGGTKLLLLPHIMLVPIYISLIYNVLKLINCNLQFSNYKLFFVTIQFTLYKALALFKINVEGKP